MPTSSKCHRVTSHCRVYKNMKKSGSCTKNGSPGVTVKAQYRPKSACSRTASSIAKLYRADTQRTARSGSGKKKKKKKSIHELLQMTKASYAMKKQSTKNKHSTKNWKKNSKKHHPALVGGKGGGRGGASGHYHYPATVGGKGGGRGGGRGGRGAAVWTLPIDY